MKTLSSASLAQIIESGHTTAHSVLIAIAALLGFALIVHDAKSWKLTLLQKIGLFLAVFGIGLLGSAIPDRFAGNILEQRAQQCVINPKTIVGGLLFGFAGAALYKKVLTIHFPTSDAFARGTCLMMAIGRMACFFQHCCFGVVTGSPWGVDFGDGVRRVPTQLLESVFLWIGLFVLQRFHRQNRFPDRRLFIFFAYYGFVRFMVEYLREPLNNPIGPLQYYQWFSIGLFITGVSQIFVRTSVRRVEQAV